MTTDPRIHTTLEHLRRLEGLAKGLNFLPRQPSASVLNGRHVSRLRGRGLNFEEMRNYLPGDDIRSIDWKATARTGSPHVRVFTEERDRPALLVVDQRMSMFFGSILNMKSVTAAEAAAAAAFRILDHGDRVGGIVFDEDDKVEIPPQRSPRALNVFLATLSRFNQKLNADKLVDEETDALNNALSSVVKLAHHNHLVVVLSDFQGINENTHRKLSAIAAHNDLILGLVHDPAAVRLDSKESIVLGDGKLQAEVNLGDSSVRQSLSDYSTGRLQTIYNWQKEINLSVIPLTSGEDTLSQLRHHLAAAAPNRRVRG